MWGTLLWIAVALTVVWKQAYMLFLHFVVALTTTYYRKILVYGINNLPREGPVILCPNHCNMMVDPFIVVSQCFKHGRRPFIWAKGSLFHNLITGWLLRGLGGVPVYRPYKANSLQDKDSDMTQEQIEAANKRMFEKTWEVLANGNAMVLFPEGTSYTRPNLLPLRTGVMRAATGFVKNYQQPLPIVPVGLTYSKKDTFRTNVVLEFGSAFFITPEDVTSKKFVQDERAEVKRLTEQLEESMRKVTLNAAEFETIRIARAMQRLYLSTGASIAEDMRVRLTQGIVDMLEHTPADQDENKTKQLKEAREQVVQYSEELDKWGIQHLDSLLAHDAQVLKQPLFERIMYFVVLMPFGLVGLVLNAPFYLLGSKLNNMTNDIESKSMLKMLANGFAVPLQWVVIGLIAWFFGGTYISYATFALLPALLLANIHMIEEARTIRDHLRLLFYHFTDRERLQALREKRQALAKTVSQLVKQGVDPLLVASVQKSIEIAENSPKHAAPRAVLPARGFSSCETVVRSS